jgi:hypothetical protein
VCKNFKNSSGAKGLICKHLDMDAGIGEAEKTALKNFCVLTLPIHASY